MAAPEEGATPEDLPALPVDQDDPVREYARGKLSLAAAVARLGPALSALSGALIAAAARRGEAHVTAGRYDAAHALVPEARALGLPHGDLAAQVFELCVWDKSRPEAAWETLAEALDGGGRPSTVSVSRQLKRAPTARGLDLVERFIAVHPGAADEVLFNALLDAAGRAGDAARLSRVERAMRAQGLPLGSVTFGALLKAHGARQDLAAVRATWAELEPQRPTTAVTYGCMLDACVRCRAFALVEEVWGEVVAAGLHRNTVLMTTMIKGYAAQRDLPKALAMKERMVAENVAPNLVTYNSLVDAAVRCHDWDTALALVGEMRGRGVGADLITYSTLAKGLCARGQLPEALALLAQLELEGVRPDAVLFHSLLEGCAKAVQPAVALGLLQRMRAQGLAPQPSTLGLVLRVLVLAGDLDGALAIAFAAPSPPVFTALVKALVEAGQAWAAAVLLQQLPAAGHWPTGPQLAAVLPPLLAAHDLRSCLDLLATAGAGPRSAQAPRPELFPSLASVVDLALGSTATRAEAAAVLDAAAAVGLCSPGQAATLQDGLRSPQGELHADAPEFTPGAPWDAGAREAAVEVEAREPLSPVNSPPRSPARKLGEKEAKELSAPDLRGRAQVDKEN